VTRTLIIQSYRAFDVPPWIARCLQSVEAWARAAGHDYRFVSDEAFALCGDDYLVRVGDNKCSITNLCRLELVRNAHREGYDWAAWIDADVFVFDPDRFSVAGPARYAFPRQVWVHIQPPDRLVATAAVNNCVFVCRAGEPDLDLLITATRHVGVHRDITSNFQVGGELIRGLRIPLAFETLDCVGMFSHPVVQALALGADEVLQFEARFHGTPVYAANLSASGPWAPALVEVRSQAAMDRLQASKGEVLNRWLTGAPPLAQERAALRAVPGIEARLDLHGQALPGARD
jgi:hypothetical protein